MANWSNTPHNAGTAPPPTDDTPAVPAGTPKKKTPRTVRREDNAATTRAVDASEQYARTAVAPPPKTGKTNQNAVTHRHGTTGRFKRPPKG